MRVNTNPLKLFKYCTNTYKQNRVQENNQEKYQKEPFTRKRFIKLSNNYIKIAIKRPLLLHWRRSRKAAKRKSIFPN
jgi:hypothetical protein